MRVPVAPEGWPFILVPAAAACILALFGWWPAATGVGIVSLACLGFFRDPERTTPTGAGLLLAPADGRVMRIDEVEDPWVGAAVRTSIFVSPLDVHVNRSPMAGLVESVDQARGRFMAAYKDEASELNERCTIALQGEGARVTVKQIAGVRFGLIRFGSRTDLVAPRSAEMRVKVGDRVRGGETVMGVLR